MKSNVNRKRPAFSGVKTWTIDLIVAKNTDKGLHYFDPGAMRFFKTRILPRVAHVGKRVFFVTSEQCEVGTFKGKRRYTVVEFVPKSGRVEAFSGFQAFASKAEAYVVLTSLEDTGSGK
jgi:hypothetical protein